MITLFNLSKEYRHYKALSHIDLKLHKNEVSAIIGSMGAGKSTLLKCIAGIIKPTSGSIEYDDDGKIVFATEEGSLFPHLTTMGNANIMSDLYPNFDKSKFITLLAKFNLPTKIVARKLSRGQQSMLEIALAVCKPGNVLLLDEPFIGMDIFTRKSLLQLLISEFGEGKTVLISTHQVSEIQPLLDKAYILKDGVIEHFIDYTKDSTDLVKAMESVYSVDID